VPDRTTTAPASLEAPVLARLSRLDRFLPVWIVLAMAAGLGVGRAIPSLADDLNSVSIGSISLPIAAGLLLMMYPVLAKVRYDRLDRVVEDRRLLISSLVLNWLVGPALMFALAWLLLPDQPAYRTGLIIVGLARCIAMVLIWNELSCGDRDAAAFLVALNSIFQIFAFAGLGWFYLHVLPGWLGLTQAGAHFSVTTIAMSVLVFLGVPLAAGYLTRRIGERTRGRDWYEARFLPRVGPVALYGLLFTIVVLFSLQGHTITGHPAGVARIGVVLIVYFAVMFTASFALGRRLRLGYPKTATLAFTAAGNNFELAIAVAISVFGAASGQALAGVVGPLIEVPVLVALVYAALWARRRYYPTDVDFAGRGAVRSAASATSTGTCPIGRADRCGCASDSRRHRGARPRASGRIGRRSGPSEKVARKRCAHRLQRIPDLYIFSEEGKCSGSGGPEHRLPSSTELARCASRPRRGSGWLAEA
jgi:ACR3 family arsenite transporter